MRGRNRRRKSRSNVIVDDLRARIEDQRFELRGTEYRKYSITNKFGSQIAAAVSVILLAVCTIAFVVSNQSSDSAEELLNVPLTNKQRGILNHLKSQKLTLGPGLENADDKAIKVSTEP
eukprot:765634-Hanusia_phi.AAC.2